MFNRKRLAALKVQLAEMAEDCISLHMQLAEAEADAVVSENNAYGKGYGSGLKQGRFDAYVGNIPPCPDCGNSLPYPAGVHNRHCPMIHSMEGGG